MSRGYFNGKADIWDEKVAEKDTGKLEQMANRLDIKTGATLLDVGTGTGIFLPYLLKKVSVDGKIIALDTAERMLSKAKEKGVEGNIDYLCADVGLIPLHDDFCDAVVCYSSLPHFPGKPKAMTEIKRVLKKGGCLYVCHTSSREHINRIHQNIAAVQNHLLPDAIEMMRLFSDAGFTKIQVEDKADSYFARGCKPI